MGLGFHYFPRGIGPKVNLIAQLSSISTRNMKKYNRKHFYITEELGSLSSNGVGKCLLKIKVVGNQKHNKVNAYIVIH